MEIFPTEYKIYDDDDLIVTVKAYDEGSSEITIHVPIDTFLWGKICKDVEKCIGDLNRERE